MTLNIPKNIPKRIAAQATEVYGKWRRGEVKPRRANCDRQCLMLEVGRAYRLLSKLGTEWKLMSHEKYNKEFR